MLKKHLGFLFNIAALFLFIPGIILPMFSLKMDMSATLSNASLSSNIIDKQLSLLETIQELWLDERVFVAILIFLFSVCIPLFKTTLICWSYAKRNSPLEKKLLNFVAAIGKWSMADVFVVAIFLAVLSTTHAETSDQQNFSMFGFNIDILISSETLSAVGLGFYYFAGYCLLSLLGTQLSQSSLSDNISNNLLDK